jgi:hypothetical protein
MICRPMRLGGWWFGREDDGLPGTLQPGRIGSENGISIFCPARRISTQDQPTCVGDSRIHPSAPCFKACRRQKMAASGKQSIRRMQARDCPSCRVARDGVLGRTEQDELSWSISCTLANHVDMARLGTVGVGSPLSSPAERLKLLANPAALADEQRSRALR